MNKDRPFISVILPTYNRGHIIDRAINSVLEQTYPNFELLIVNDHSTDETGNLIAQYDDERIQYLTNKRKKGAQGARNTGILAAQGSYIALLDSDDAWKPSKLKKQVQFFQHSPFLDLVYTGVVVIEPDGQKQNLYRKHLDNYFNTLLKENCIGSVSSVLVKKKTLFEVGLFDENLPALQDLDMWLRISKNYNIDVITELMIYKYEMKETSRNRVYNLTNRIDGLLQILEKYRHDFEQNKHIYASRLYQLSKFMYKNRDVRFLYYMPYAFGIKLLSFITD